MPNGAPLAEPHSRDGEGARGPATTGAEDGADAAWTGWSQALIGVVLPGGLGADQRFAFGQTTLVVDFANADAQVANAEIFRIGDTVPAAGPNFVPWASLSEAYGFFLGRIAAADLVQERAQWAAANSAQPSAYNMPAKIGAQAPAGSHAVPIGGDPGSTESASRAVLLPAYELDSGFRTRYEEWQRASAAGQHGSGGVIRFSAAVGSAPPRPPQAVLRSQTRPSLQAPTAARDAPATGQRAQAEPMPPFFRVIGASNPLAPAASLGRTVLRPRPTLMRAEAAPAEPAALAAADAAARFTLEVSFTGLGTFMLGPARWFSDAAVRFFAIDLTTDERQRFFAERQGVMARRIYQVVIGFEPALKLRFDDRGAFLQARSLLSDANGAALGIGPLHVDPKRLGSAGAAVSDEDQTISIGAMPSTLPVLLGVISTSFGASA